MKKLIKSESGGVIITAALAFMVLMASVGVAIDMSRQYAVKNALQKALDTALLGSVATSDELPVVPEATRLFHANYPAKYMGSEILNLTVHAPTVPSVYKTNSSTVGRSANVRSSRTRNIANTPPVSNRDLYTGEFIASVQAKVPNVIMQLFGLNENVIRAKARVLNILKEHQVKVELALILDNTGSMAGKKLADLKKASHLILEILFGGETKLDNFHTSIIPYWTAVVMKPADFPGMRNWVQSTWKPRYDVQIKATGQAYFANRNLDNLISTHVDATGVAPTSELTRFRTPVYKVNNIIPYNPRNTYPAPSWPKPFWCPDSEFPGPAAPMMFAENIQRKLHARINEMKVRGCTRINVGAQWGWMALSPAWKGIWSSAKPNLPRLAGKNVQKIAIMMTDGQNTVYTGTGPKVSHDDKTTAAVCAGMKKAGITIYSVTLGPSVNATLMGGCATSSAHYFHAPTSAQLSDVFQAIAGKIKEEWLRLSR